MDTKQSLTRGEILLFAFVIIYWLSPVDAMPMNPIDDVLTAWLAIANRGDLAPAIDRFIAEMTGGE